MVFRGAATLTAAVALLALTLAVGSHADASRGLSNAALRQLLLTEPVAHLYTLGNISDVDGALVRTFLSPAHRLAATQIRQWMEEAGLTTWVDAVGNVHGRTRTGSQEGGTAAAGDKAASVGAPAIVIGSHYDTVNDAGRYDGLLGIIAGIAAVKAAVAVAAADAKLLPASLLKQLEKGDSSSELMAALAEASTLLRHPVEVVAFTDEEGVRFGTTFLGSRAIAGSLVSSGLLEAHDAQGTTLQTVLAQELFSDATHAAEAADAVSAAVEAIAMRPDSVKGYVEVHMEQGPALEQLGLPLAPVAAIVGATRLVVAISGMQGHAGTVPMALRRDPLAAAAEAITVIERSCGGGNHPEGLPPGTEEAWKDVLVCTVGSISVWPGSSNVIASSANFTVDIRCGSNSRRQSIVADITSAIKDLCSRRSVDCVVSLVHDADAVQMDESVVAALERAAAQSRPLLIRVLNPESPLTKTPPAHQAADEKQHASVLPSDDTLTDSSGDSSISGMGICANIAGSDGTSSADSGSQCAAQPSIPAALFTEDGGLQSEGDSSKQADAGAHDARGSHVRGTDAATTREEPPPRFVSGAGHDAMAVAGQMPAGMLFVRCRNGGISHSPEELVDDVDVAASTAALLAYILEESS